MSFITKFEGNINQIDPEKLINPTKDDGFDNFCLALSYIYNDFKGINFLFINFLMNLEKPVDTKISAHNGEYIGVQLQCVRLMIGSIYEFLTFLKDNEAILDSYEFKLLLKKTNKDTQFIWNDFINVIKNKKINNNKFVNILNKIRSNITFHYTGAAGILRKNYIEFFFNTAKKPENEFAYYSITGKMSDSRFYYADAAAMLFYYNVTKEFPDFDKLLSELMERVNFGILAILKVYLAGK